MRRYALTFASAAAVAALVTTSPAALAGQPLTIEIDQSQLVILPSTPGSIVIGNPSIADATVQGTNLFMHGRSYGTTNIMVLDMNGQQLGAFDVSVSHSTANAMTVFKGGMRYSYNCATNCESELQIGDSGVYSENIAAQIQLKNKLATGQTDAKSEAPPAPQ
jgi:Pilus formation protein N terminal region